MSVKTRNPFAVDLEVNDLDKLMEIASLTEDRDPTSAINSDLPVGVYGAALNGGAFAKTSAGDKIKFTFKFTLVGGDFHGRTRNIIRVIKTDDGGDSYLRLRNDLKIFGVDAINPTDIIEQLVDTEQIECGIVVTAGSKVGSVFYNIVSLEAMEDYLD